MKQFFIFTLVGLSLISCKETSSQQDDMATVSEEVTASAMSVFGEDFKNETTLTAFELVDIYKNLKVGDTVKVTFEGYGFFVPKDLGEKKVVVHGEAFISETSVDEQQHYAKDGGKSEAEIAAITLPKKNTSKHRTMDEETKELVYKFYQKDFKIFGYKK